MLFIGLLIALAAVVFAVVVLAEDWGGATYTIHGFGHVLGHLTLAGIFLCGIIITAIFFAALWMASVSSMMRRRASNRRRAEHRAVRDERESLLDERDRLARELDAERAAHGADNAAYTDREVAGGGGRHAVRSDGGRTIDLDERERLAAYDERAAAEDPSRRHTV
jgi:uncharacterized membrane protein